uniref:Peptidase A2 domain-containing protein n=1 Tax=Psilocybe cubensis TaxID=181762 RepID=A0A8H7XUK8_PSICU
MSALVTVTVRDLLGSAPQVREHLQKDVTPIKISTSQLEPLAVFILTNKLDSQKQYKVGNNLYLQLLQQGEKKLPTSTYTGKETKQLRSLWPKINGVEEIKAIMDSGSQIVSMSEEVALRTGLSWDPNVTINMESANKTINHMLGLARNVPFTFGGITIYLQVHVIRNPAYTILLGRTFDSLTRSNVQTEHDGSATICIEDPNTGRKAVVPIFEQGRGPKTCTDKRKKKAEGF